MNLITTDVDAQSRALAQAAAALERAAAAIVADGEPPPAVVFEAPRNPDFGDFASNVALQLAKRARRAPQQLAAELVERIFEEDPSLRAVLSEATAAGGFVNIRLAAGVWQSVVAAVLREGSDFGRERSVGERVSLDFGSAIQPDRSSSCKDARFRSAIRWQKRCASWGTTLRPNGSSMTPARNSIPSAARCTRATGNLPSRVFRFPKTAIRPTTCSRSLTCCATATGRAGKTPPRASGSRILQSSAETNS